MHKQGLTIAENLAKIQERLLKTCDRVGRDPNEVILMGVTKFVPKDRIKEAFGAGIRYFGESRVKEAAEKFSGFNEEFPEAFLHLIGSLQRNKVKQSLLLFDCIQSVDRIELIEELIKQCFRDGVSLRDKPIKVLLELHTGEETKCGFADFDALFRAAQMVLSNPCLKPAGLMTMAPFTTDTSVIRSSFRLLVKAQKELEKRFGPKENWAVLSMGMSSDFEIAIEEGSNLLRIGSLIFSNN
ncbi:MAG: YggS family pyridoxal phosphate-dependent enzyme [Treponema sp.]|jgi:pyridoxal phosphate enzyme (YggS family)|nr:YggS family pyridoxal phosphate-dependent enzyme [Treponema sp.]